MFGINAVGLARGRGKLPSDIVHGRLQRWIEDDVFRLDRLSSMHRLAFCSAYQTCNGSQDRDAKRTFTTPILPQKRLKSPLFARHSLKNEDIISLLMKLYSLQREFPQGPPLPDEMGGDCPVNVLAA